VGVNQEEKALPFFRYSLPHVCGGEPG